MLIDTHAHLDFKDFNTDRDEVIKRAFRNGIGKIINIGCDLNRAKKSIELAGENKNIFATIGVHPDEAGKSKTDEILKNLESLLEKSDKIVGIGECGLDYSRVEDEALKKLQKELFIAQINFAKAKKLPLVIHIRDAYSDAFEILKDYPDQPGVLHCFGGSVKDAKKFLDLGFLISFTGIVTFKNAKEVQEVAKFVPLEKMMFETDCPFLAPEPYRGERNEPAYVKFIARKISEIKGVSLSDVERVTTENAKSLFTLKV